MHQFHVFYHVKKRLYMAKECLKLTLISLEMFEGTKNSTPSEQENILILYLVQTIKTFLISVAEHKSTVF